MTAGPQSPEPKRRASRRKLTTPDYQALGAFRHALRKFLAFSEAGSDAMGLTSQQHQALLAVRAHSGTEAMTVGELAESLLIRNHSALGLAERLIERGLLRRAPSPQDRRRVLLYLTVDGARHLEGISRNNLGQLKSTLPVFTDLLRALEQLELPPPSE
ncbi:MAG: MarR family winged helix-turn-helix transcriptional regulator [Phenylobacterium sp.]